MGINCINLLLQKRHKNGKVITNRMFQKGNKLGKKFSSESQPESNGRPQGVQNRSTVARQVLNTMLQMPDDIFEKAKEIYPAIQRQLTTEQFATWAVAFKIIRTGDQAALKALLDSAYGNTKQEIDIIGEINITDNKIGIKIKAPVIDEED